TRRHTRSQDDWSSDVCSSDLRLSSASLPTILRHHPLLEQTDTVWCRYHNRKFLLLSAARLCLRCQRSRSSQRREARWSVHRARRSEERRVGEAEGARGRGGAA